MNYSARVRYAELLRDLEGLDDWLVDLGIPPQQTDRTHRSINVLERAELAYASQSDAETAGISKSEYLFSLTEAFELRDVYLAFRNHPPEQLRERIARALSGPILPENETEKNRDGRNVMFELALGAEWTLCGGTVQLVEPDLLLRMPNQIYLIACKRPERESSVRASIRDAARQLRSALGTSGNALGVIAISFSRILNPGKRFFAGTFEDLSNLLNQLMLKHRQSWQTTDFHPRNVAILFHCHTPADWGEGLFRLSASRMGPSLLEAHVHDNIRNDLERLYSGNLRRNLGETERNP